MRAAVATIAIVSTIGAADARSSCLDLTVQESIDGATAIVRGSISARGDTCAAECAWVWSDVEAYAVVDEVIDVVAVYKGVAYEHQVIAQLDEGPFDDALPIGTSGIFALHSWAPDGGVLHVGACELFTPEEEAEAAMILGDGGAPLPGSSPVGICTEAPLGPYRQPSCAVVDGGAVDVDAGKAADGGAVDEAPGCGASHIAAAPVPVAAHVAGVVVLFAGRHRPARRRRIAGST